LVIYLPINGFDSDIGNCQFTCPSTGYIFGPQDSCLGLFNGICASAGAIGGSFFVWSWLALVAPRQLAINFDAPGSTGRINQQVLQ
jgi:hypothetical protein